MPDDRLSDTNPQTAIYSLALILFFPFENMFPFTQGSVLWKNGP